MLRHPASIEFVCKLRISVSDLPNLLIELGTNMQPGFKLLAIFSFLVTGLASMHSVSVIC